MIVNKPPLGWNTWNTFGYNINEELVLKSADAMVETGLKDAGYEYIVIDDVWALRERDSEGHLVPDPEKFPHGMKYIADYIHSKGLKFGMYSCAGYLTCTGYPGSYGYEWEDAKTFASWDVDFLKYDYCYHPSTVQTDILYKRMGVALRNCGRDILYSTCSWGAQNTKAWIKQTGANMWRSTEDIFDCWASVRKLAQSQLLAQEFNGHGCFNDMDMLVVGMNGKGNVGMTGCTEEEYRLHFSLWALLSSPLMIGCDIRNMSESTKAILSNRDVIAINQDCYSQPFIANTTYSDTAYAEDKAKKISYAGDYPIDEPIVVKYLENGDFAIGFFNLGEGKADPFNSVVNFDTLGIPDAKNTRVEMTDLWTGEKIMSRSGVLEIKPCEAHSARLFRARIVG